jgi:hypothetical protein
VSIKDLHLMAPGKKEKYIKVLGYQYPLQGKSVLFIIFLKLNECFSFLSYHYFRGEKETHMLSHEFKEVQ